MRSVLVAFLVFGLVAGCQRQTPDDRLGTSARIVLPTGRVLDPAGRSIDVGNMPLSIALSPDRSMGVLLLSGWSEQGVQVIDLGSGKVVQTLTQPAAFRGLTFSNDGQTLFTSGAARDVVYRYAWSGNRARLVDSIIVGPFDSTGTRVRFVGALALSRDGTKLYVAENMADSLAVIDVRTGVIAQRVATGHYPYDVAVAPDGNVFVSAWGGQTVSRFSANPNGSLHESTALRVGRHPSALLLNNFGTRLFVASSGTDEVFVVDSRAGRIIDTLRDAAPSGPSEGSTPNALLLSPDGTRLFVAEADNNAVAVFDLSERDSGVPVSMSTTRLAGRIPVAWYPVAMSLHRDSLLVLSAKGRGTRANPSRAKQTPAVNDPPNYVLGQLNGVLSVVALPAGPEDLRSLTQRVARANGWDATRSVATYPPFDHAILIIKENRTYDQVLGDLPGGDGDTSLTFFPRDVSPNHHALAERFGNYDRFFVNAEVSAQGHPWSTSAYVTEYTEKLTPTWYSDRRPEREEGEVDEPASGFLWNAAIRQGVSLRNYGEYAQPVGNKYEATKPALAPFTNTDYPSFDMRVPDQRRADVWLADFAKFQADGQMPKLQILHLPGDHTAGARANMCTPRACMADNDLALGRIIEALSRSKFWRSTAVFVLEDDAQDGPDHIDSHRSVLFVISPYNRPGLVHRFVNTTDVLATIEEILGLKPLSQFDHYGRALHTVWSTSPDLTPYRAMTPLVSLDERNPAGGVGARESEKLDLTAADRIDDRHFNALLWRVIKGDRPYPPPARQTMLDFTRDR